jgi:hypothetical protein
MNINITKHARERWVERVNPEAGDMVEKQVFEAVNKAEHIWQDKEGIDFYIDNNFIEYVCDLKKQAVITLFDIDYGFPKDINNKIANDLIQKVRLARENVEATKVNQTKQREKNEIEKTRYLMDISGLQEKIKKLESQIKQIDANNQQMDAELNIVQKEFENLAYQLTYSKNYKMEKLVKGA